MPHLDKHSNAQTEARVTDQEAGSKERNAEIIKCKCPEEGGGAVLLMIILVLIRCCCCCCCDCESSNQKQTKGHKHKKIGVDNLAMDP
ncbi:small integral membrane protein 22 isoform X2 [Ambystoma mexicanum]|uniref:small integral membrane protein 22 isoform X2 n=1 Tax=Ambystoma mexicanum TaxID=8296 RepID=UPI0037E98326